MFLKKKVHGKIGKFLIMYGWIGYLLKNKILSSPFLKGLGIKYSVYKNYLENDMCTFWRLLLIFFFWKFKILKLYNYRQLDWFCVTIFNPYYTEQKNRKKKDCICSFPSEMKINCI